jgi:hypothetical protein
MLDTILVTLLVLDALCVTVVIADEIRWSLSGLRNKVGPKKAPLAMPWRRGG